MLRSVVPRRERGFALAPMTVAAFYRRTMAELAAAGIAVAIDVVPNEIADADRRFPTTRATRATTRPR